MNIQEATTKVLAKALHYLDVNDNAESSNEAIISAEIGLLEATRNYLQAARELGPKL